MVSTNKGQIRGIQALTCQYFLGITYAKPPKGVLRFQEPQSMDPWNGIKDTISFIWCFSIVLAFLLTIPLGIIWSIHYTKCGGEDLGFIVLWWTWALGPIAVIGYTIGIILGIRQLFIDYNVVFI